ncbi:MAG: PAC2 family protein [Candidatus Methanospirareceae archaeon]
MSIKGKIEIRYIEKIRLKEPVAIVGSSGLRSVGKIAVDFLAKKTNAKLFAELYSYSFPTLYYGPSYLCPPSSAGVEVRDGLIELPKIKFYAIEEENIIITVGYQAHNVIGQYMVADKVTDLFKHLNVKKIISLGAQTLEEGIRCCVTDIELLDELNKYGIEKTSVDRFIGFSGLIIGIGKIKGMKGICLLGDTTQNFENPESPDFGAVKRLLEKISYILGMEIDFAELEEEEETEEEMIMEKIAEMREKKEKEKEKEVLRGYI